MSRRTNDAWRDVVRDFRRDQIIDVARRLFGERGTVEVSMDDIATEAGVARSTVYVYFANRDELVGACLRRMHQLLQDALAEAWDREGVLERLEAVVLGLFELIDDSPAFFRVAMATQASRTNVGATVDAELSVIGLDLARLLHDLVLQGSREGLLRLVDPDVAATLIGQQIYGAMTIRAGEPNRVPALAAARQVCDFVLNGLAVRPGTGPRVAPTPSGTEGRA